MASSPPNEKRTSRTSTKPSIPVGSLVQQSSFYLSHRMRWIVDTCDASGTATPSTVATTRTVRERTTVLLLARCGYREHSASTPRLTNHCLQTRTSSPPSTLLSGLAPQQSAEEEKNDMAHRSETTGSSFSGRRAVTHLLTRTRASPNVKADPQQHALNAAHQRFCPNSPFWPLNFDLAGHRKSLEAERARLSEIKTALATKVTDQTPHPRTLQPFTHNHPRPAFDGKEFFTNRSAVLAEPTVFCVSWRRGKEDVAPCPSRSERKHEGDDRISTDRIHGRFLGAPREDGGGVIGWQQCAIIEQFPLDAFGFARRHAVEIFLLLHVVPELEFSEEEGTKALEADFMHALDPSNQ